MRKRHLLATAAAAVGLAGLAALAAVAPSQAEPPVATLGVLSVQPPTGLDVTAPTYTTSAGCPTSADGYNLFVFGPGGFVDGLIGTTPTDVGFSSSAPFPVLQGLSFKDIALDNSATVVPGKYTIVVSCVDLFTQEVKGTFTRDLFFTDATHYQATDPSSTTTTTTTTTTTQPTTTTSSTTTTTQPTTTTTEPTTTTTEPTTTTTTTQPTSTTTTTTVPTSTTTSTTSSSSTTTTQPTTTTTTAQPTTTTTTNPGGSFTLAVSKQSGKDIEAPTYTTSTGCGENASDNYQMFLHGPGVFQQGLIAATPSDVGFSRTSPMNVLQYLSFKDIAVDAGGEILPGDYRVEVDCIESFGGTKHRTFTTGIRFTTATDWQVIGAPPTTTTTTQPTTTTTTSQPTTTQPTDTTTTDTPTDTTTTTAGGGSQTIGLAVTGSPLRNVIVLGGLLIAIGGLILVFARRRRA